MTKTQTFITTVVLSLAATGLPSCSDAHHGDNEVSTLDASASGDGQGLDLHSPSPDIEPSDGRVLETNHQATDIIEIDEPDGDEEDLSEVDADEDHSDRCVGRVIEAYNPETGGWEETAVCQRNQRCLSGECVELPTGFGESCEDEEDCEHDELGCRESTCTTAPPSEAGGRCNGSEECQDELVCTRRGVCQAGTEGDGCGSEEDCSEAHYCGTTEQCQPNRNLGEVCGPDAQCASGNCSNDHCAPDGFSYIPAGTFCMGSPGAGGSEGCPDREAEPGADVNEDPLHQVTLTRAFFMQQTEVTQEQWHEVLENSPSYFHDCGDDCPVESVNWFEALEYVNARSEAEGLESCFALTECDETPIGEGMLCNVRPQVAEERGVYACEGYRLPTEAEWEYAYRAGTTTAFYSGGITHTGTEPLDPGLNTIAWYGGNSEVGYSSGLHCEAGTPEPLCGPHVTAQKQPNAWGLYDMAGNVSEWVWDIYGEYASEPVVDPLGAGRFWSRVLIRGGQWNGFSWGCRAASRQPYAAAFDNDTTGIRVVRTVPVE